MKPSEELYNNLQQLFTEGKDVIMLLWQIHNYHNINSIEKLQKEIKNAIKI